MMGQSFPSAYFNQISVGAFTKSLAFPDLVGDFAALAAFSVGFLALARLLLKTQET